MYIHIRSNDNLLMMEIHLYFDFCVSFIFERIINLTQFNSIQCWLSACWVFSSPGIWSFHTAGVFRSRNSIAFILKVIHSPCLKKKQQIYEIKKNSGSATIFQAQRINYPRSNHCLHFSKHKWGVLDFVGNMVFWFVALG